MYIEMEGEMHLSYHSPLSVMAAVNTSTDCDIRQLAATLWPMAVQGILKHWHDYSRPR